MTKLWQEAGKSNMLAFGSRKRNAYKKDLKVNSFLLSEIYFWMEGDDLRLADDW